MTCRLSWWVNPTKLPGVNTLPKLIETARAQKDPLNYTTSGAGSFGHMSMELLKELGKFDMQHVAYKGGRACHYRHHWWSGAHHVCRPGRCAAAHQIRQAGGCGCGLARARERGARDQDHCRTRH